MRRVITTVIDVPDDKEILDLGSIEHPATQMVLLEGQPAPELRDVDDWAYPTTVLIDRSGTVVGKFNPGDAKDIAKLKTLLDSE